MPIDEIHDAHVLEEALRPWLAHRLGWRDVSLSGFEQPLDNGGSNETRFIDVRWADDAGAHQRSFVLRVEPTDHRFFLVADLAAQCELLGVVARHGVPVPEIVALEADPQVIGAPFALMERVAGYIPARTYNEHGPLFEAPVEQRRVLWRNALSTVVTLGAVPVAELPMLHRANDRPPGLAQEMSHAAEELRWAAGERDTEGLVTVAQELEASMPAAEAALSWGDARVGNMIFRGLDVVAVIDWEQASLAGPLADLAWWCLFDEFHSTARGVERLEGLPDRAETLDFWCELGGAEPVCLDWYLRFAALRLATIFLRVASMAADRGDHAMIDAVWTDNFALRFLRDVGAR